MRKRRQTSRPEGKQRCYLYGCSSDTGAGHPHAHPQQCSGEKAAWNSHVTPGYNFRGSRKQQRQSGQRMAALVAVFAAWQGRLAWLASECEGSGYGLTERSTARWRDQRRR